MNHVDLPCGDVAVKGGAVVVHIDLIQQQNLGLCFVAILKPLNCLRVKDQMMRTRTILFDVAVTLISIVSLGGCTASSSRIVDLNIKPQRDTVIEVMPFAAAKVRFAMSDAWGHHGLAGVVINAYTGIYTYKFDDYDYSNIRKSLIDSLQNDNSFRAIQDIENENEVGKGTRLYINFTESGMHSYSLGGFACLLKAYTWTEDPGGSIMAKSEITVEGTSLLSVNRAKNQAIEMFVHEVAKLLSD